MSLFCTNEEQAGSVAQSAVLFPQVSSLPHARTVFPVLEKHTGGERWDANPFTNQ